VAAKGFIRHELLERMGVRRVPDLSFHVDKSEKFQSRIDELLGRAKKRKKSVAPAAETAIPDPVPDAAADASASK
jgi:ribosome-binding factor A